MSNVPISLIYLVILISFFIIITVLYLVYYLNKRNKIPPGEEKANLLIWGPETQSDNKNKNTCLLYSFPPYEVTGGVENLYFPGNPTLDFDILNGMTGVKSNVTCVDVDQIVAKEVYRECIKLSDDENPINLCILPGDGRADLGDKKLYYSSQCSQNKLCPGSLSIIRMGTNPINCINSTNDGTLTQCNFSDNNQLIRVVRKNPNTPVDNGRSGQLIQLYDRNRNLCLLPNDGLSFQGNGVKFTNCGSDPFVWYYLPSRFVTNQGKTTTTPPQLVYVKDGNIDIENKLALSARGSQLILDEISLDSNSTYGRSQNTDIVNYLLHNIE